MIKCKYPFNSESINEILKYIKYDGTNCSIECPFLEQGSKFCKLLRTEIYNTKRNNMCIIFTSKITTMYKIEVIKKICRHVCIHSEEKCSILCDYYDRKSGPCNLFITDLTDGDRCEPCKNMERSSYL